eukprot:m.247465 g.247465  ORF g.247465 m.247465 type:complete len:397 (-) comp15397_c0_seq1:48-1238(-)
MSASVGPCAHAAVLAAINSGGEDAFVQNFACMYENFPVLARRAWLHAPFRDWNDIALALLDVLANASPVEQRALFAADHDLGTTADDETARREDAYLGLAGANCEYRQRLGELNTLYTARCGFRFITCVRRHCQASLVREFEDRCYDAGQPGGVAREVQRALAEVAMVMLLRLQDRAAQLAAKDSDNATVTGFPSSLPLCIAVGGLGRASIEADMGDSVGWAALIPVWPVGPHSGPGPRPAGARVAVRMVDELGRPCEWMRVAVTKSIAAVDHGAVASHATMWSLDVSGTAVFALQPGQHCLVLHTEEHNRRLYCQSCGLGDHKTPCKPNMQVSAIQTRTYAVVIEVDATAQGEGTCVLTAPSPSPGLRPDHGTAARLELRGARISSLTHEHVLSE